MKQIKIEYKLAIATHTANKKAFKRAQSESSLGIGSLQALADATFALYKSYWDVRAFHIAYSLLRGRKIEEIESNRKNLSSYQEKVLNSKVEEYMNKYKPVLEERALA